VARKRVRSDRPDQPEGAGRLGHRRGQAGLQLPGPSWGFGTGWSGAEGTQPPGAGEIHTPGIMDGAVGLFLSAFRRHLPPARQYGRLHPSLQFAEWRRRDVAALPRSAGCFPFTAAAHDLVGLENLLSASAWLAGAVLRRRESTGTVPSALRQRQPARIAPAGFRESLKAGAAGP